MSIKVCHITTVHPVFCARIFYKECLTLRAAGYEVHLIAVHDRNQEVDGVHIEALPEFKGRWQRFLLGSWLAFRSAWRLGASVYHIHDPELLPIGLLLTLLGKRVVYDVHEDLPKQILIKHWLGNENFRRLLSYAAGWMERVVGWTFAGIVTVIPEIHARFPPDKTVMVRNFVRLSFIDSIPPVPTTKTRPILIYPGALTAKRGVREMVRVMEKVSPTAELWLFGRWESDALRKECEQMPGWQHVTYFGAVKPEQVYASMKCADIGMQLIHKVPNHEGGLPVKAFEYMACSLPFIITDQPAKRKTFGDVAIFVDPLDLNEIVDQINGLLSDPKRAKEYGRRGRERVERHFSWEPEGKQLVEFYKKLLGGSGSDTVKVEI